MREVAIVSPVRTAVGNFGGTLRDISAADLASAVIKEALDRTKLDPGPGGRRHPGARLPQRREPGHWPAASLKAGLPIEVPATSLTAAVPPVFKRF